MSIPFLIIFYYVVINLVSFILMFYDKQASKTKSLAKFRIRENTLLICGLLGGAGGSLGSMYLLRHKTKHVNFIIVFWFSFLIHIFIIGYFFHG